MNIIKNLPNELIYIIYSFIDIDTRLDLLLSRYSMSLVNSMNYCLSIEECIKLYTCHIMNKLLKRNLHNQYPAYSLLPLLSQELPKVTYKRDLRSKTLCYVPHQIETFIVDLVSTRCMPKGYHNWIPRNLETKQREFLRNTINKIYNIFPSLEGEYSQFLYVLKRSLMFYLLALIQKGKPEYEKSRCLRDHIRIKQYTKKWVFKELRKKWVQYNKRSKLREKELVKKQKELSKKRKNTEKLSVALPKKIIIIRKRKTILHRDQI